MAVEFREVTREELEKRRAELLAKHRVTVDELCERVRDSSLEGDEYHLVDELRAIFFLLGEPDPFCLD